MSFDAVCLKLWPFDYCYLVQSILVVTRRYSGFLKTPQGRCCKWHVRTSLEYYITAKYPVEIMPTTRFDVAELPAVVLTTG
jgi:hypothetical protein